MASSTVVPPSPWLRVCLIEQATIPWLSLELDRVCNKNTSYYVNGPWVSVKRSSLCISSHLAHGITMAYKVTWLCPFQHKVTQFCLLRLQHSQPVHLMETKHGVTFDILSGPLVASQALCKQQQSIGQDHLRESQTVVNYWV